MAEAMNLVEAMTRLASVVSDCAELTAENAKLRAACSTCERAITEFVDAEQPTSTDWVNVVAARNSARAALAETEPKK